MSRDVGLRVIFSGIITHSDVSPLILPTDPNSSFSTPVLSSFPSLLSALLNQGAQTIALERQFFTLILRPVVMEIGLFIHHHSTPHTWNMNDEFEFFCVCVQGCVYVSECVCVGGGGFQQLITSSVIPWKEEKDIQRRGKRCVEWRQEGRKSALCRIAFSAFADRASDFA